MYEEVSIQQKGNLPFEIHEIIVVCTSNSITTIFTIYFWQKHHFGPYILGS